MDPKILKTFKELGDIYKILGIEPTDDKKAIKKAYKTQALINHPDKLKTEDANEKFHKIKKAYEILMDTDLKSQFDKYKQNQKYHEERTASQNKERKKFADDLISKEKASQQSGNETKPNMSKEEQKREESKRMKKEWEQEEEKRRQELEKKKAEKVESKEFTMIKIKWPKNEKMTYTDDILKILFGKYGEIKDVVVFPGERKALIEFKYRLSAEKAYQENKKKEKEKMGFDDGLRISLLVKEKDKDENKQEGLNDLNLNSGNINKISDILNRDSKIIFDSREEELRKQRERQKIIDEILMKEGLHK